MRCPYCKYICRAEDAVCPMCGSILPPAELISKNGAEHDRRPATVSGGAAIDTSEPYTEAVSSQPGADRYEKPVGAAADGETPPVAALFAEFSRFISAAGVSEAGARSIFAALAAGRLLVFRREDGTHGLFRRIADFFIPGCEPFFPAADKEAPVTADELLQYLRGDDEREPRMTVLPEKHDRKFGELLARYAEHPEEGRMKHPPVQSNFWFLTTEDCVPEKLPVHTFITLADITCEPTAAAAADEERGDIVTGGFTARCAEAREEFWLSEKAWGCIDRIEAAYARKSRLPGFDNRLLRRMEQFTSVFLASGGTEAEALDRTILYFVIPAFAALGDGWQKDLTAIISDVCDADAVPLTIDCLKTRTTEEDNTNETDTAE